MAKKPVAKKAAAKKPVAKKAAVKKAAKPQPSPGYSIRMQVSTKTGKFRAKLILDDGTEYVTGPVCDDEFGARISAIAAAKEKTFNRSDYGQFLNKVKAGTVTDKEFAARMDLTNPNC